MWTQTAFALLFLVGVAFCYPDSRIVNGHNAAVTNYPYMASLRDYTNTHTCGCSILAPSWILTAAHCVSDKIASQLSIKYGVTDIDAVDASIAYVKRIIIHRGYAPLRSYANDIALLELTDQLVFNFETISPVILPYRDYETPQIIEGAPGLLTGWGLDMTGGSTQNILQKVDLKIYSDAQCTTRHNYETTTDHICGGVDEGGKGQCTGDSGGPLMHVRADGLVQVGIVSWSKKPCAANPYPGVYTKVSHYVDWIYENMKSLD